MEQIEERLSEISLRLLNIEVIEGAHAGSICRIEVQDEESEVLANYIYKEFATDRNNEVEIYLKLGDDIKPFSPLVKVWDSPPQAILMRNLNTPLKKDFPRLSMTNKRKRIEDILHRLIALHCLNLGQAAIDFPTHQITSEWREWCIDQLNRLGSRNQWAKDEWVITINHAYAQLDIPNYKCRCQSIITHGDPHLENIFYYENQIWFIDWEWAALGSPLRDLTILLQDIYDSELIQYVNQSYKRVLKNKNIHIDAEDYRSDFNYLYIDHTTMMLAWEIEKYLQGYISDEEIRNIIDFKIQEIKRVMNAE